MFPLSIFSIWKRVLHILFCAWRVKCPAGNGFYDAPKTVRTRSALRNVLVAPRPETANPFCKPAHGADTFICMPKRVLNLYSVTFNEKRVRVFSVVSPNTFSVFENLFCAFPNELLYSVLDDDCVLLCARVVSERVCAMHFYTEIAFFVNY